MTTAALYRTGRPSLLLKPQMAPLTLAMEGSLQVQAASLGPQAVAGLALLHRLALAPDVALPLIFVMALGAGHPPGLVQPVAEWNRRLTAGAPERHFEETRGRGLGEPSGMGSQQCQHPQDQPRHTGQTAAQGHPHLSPDNKRRRKYLIPKR